MRILITGATSKIGRQLLEKLFAEPNVTEVIAFTRSPVALKHESETYLGKLKVIQGDLLQPASFGLIPQVDLCVHLAALTHTKNEESYFEVNFRATLQLAHQLFSNGCKRFCFVSSQTAGENAGAYALSKFQAEKDLLAMDWQQLLILRPTEIVGAGSQEGLDNFVSLAQKRHVYPWLLASLLNPHQIVFSPLTADSLNEALVRSLFQSPMAKKIQVVRGPQISATELASLLLKKFKAIPIPVYVPALRFVVKLLSLFGIHLVANDQIPRLLGQRWQKPVPGIEIEDVVVPGGLT